VGAAPKDAGLGDCLFPPHSGGPWAASPFAGSSYDRRVKTDLVLAPFDAGIGDMVDVAQAADAGGFDTVWTNDHFSGLVFGRRWSRDPWVALGAIAARTERVNVGVLVANVVNRHPAQLVSAMNSLQSLAPGRVLLGLGAGAAAGTRWASESDSIGRTDAPVAERRALLIESIAVLRAIWRNEAYPGERVSIAADAAVTDGSRAPPIIVGASTVPTLEVACDHADGANLLPGPDLADRVALARSRRPDDFDIGVFAKLDTGHPLGGDPEPFAHLGVDRRTLGVNAPYPLETIRTIGAALL
jgi:alkanesulfonate monooxygenase SsuD/methylene tetrahydromethanopterin reductase-like flavin-dependent oxidoreductase (luciferase family)